MENKMNEKAKSIIKPQEINALALAYLGDAIYEVYIREHVLLKGNYKQNILHKRTIAYVSAKSQAKIIKRMQLYLTEDELDIVKRGRNMKSNTSPKNTIIIDYRNSTGFETLIGYLYLQGKISRLEEIIQMAINYIEEA